VLPLDGQVNANGIRCHVQRVGRRCEQDLLAEPDTETRAEEWPTDNIPPPKPSITVGLDGGYLRSRNAPNRQEGWFEVIASKSTVQDGALRCFAFVHHFLTDRGARSENRGILIDARLRAEDPCTSSSKSQSNRRFRKAGHWM
jgi:hypothetical protein